MVGLLGQRAVKGNDVTVRKQLVRLHVANGIPVVQHMKVIIKEIIQIKIRIPMSKFK